MDKKILVVDDERRIVEILQAYLERDGYRVITAYDGRSALELARSNSPDLIILDLMLPEVSGWDVCRELRKETDVPIIMLTARDDITDGQDGFGNCLTLASPQYCSYPGDDFLRIKGLGNIIIGPEFQPDNLVGGIIAGGQHDYRHIRFPAQFPAYVPPRNFGKH